MPHVLVAGRIHDAGLALLRDESSYTFELVEDTSPDSYARAVNRADAVLLRTQPMTAEVIDRATRLKIVSRHGVGYDAVNVAALSARGIPLTIVGDVNSSSVAEHTIMLVLAIAKRTLAYDTATRTSGWQHRNSFDAIELHGRTLLVIGFGRIGRAVARIANGLGMRVLAYDPYVSADVIQSAGAAKAIDIGSALEVADVVTLHIPLSDGKAVIGATELARMKSSAILINTARGGLIDEEALAAALAAGRLAGAGVDVFASEPPLSTHPLLTSSQTVLSPHSAGLTRECAARMSVAAVQNILDFFAGRLDPSMVVNAQSLVPGERADGDAPLVR